MRLGQFLPRKVVSCVSTGRGALKGRACPIHSDADGLHVWGRQWAIRISKIDKQYNEHNEMNDSLLRWSSPSFGTWKHLFWRRQRNIWHSCCLLTKLVARFACVADRKLDLAQTEQAVSVWVWDQITCSLRVNCSRVVCSKMQPCTYVSCHYTVSLILVQGEPLVSVARTVRKVCTELQGFHPDPTGELTALSQTPQLLLRVHSKLYTLAEKLPFSSFYVKRLVAQNVKCICSHAWS